METAPVGERSKEKTIELDCLKDRYPNKPDREFTIRALFNSDENVVEISAINYVGGVPLVNMSPMTQTRALAMATTEIGVVKGPEWWISASDCEISDVVFELNDKISEWTVEFQDKLKKKQPASTVKK